MILNSQSLFHFTNNINNIENILREGYFWPIYCAEVDKEHEDHIHAYAFPMVCFCDIPLSQIAEHTNDYGYYAIAMSKGWAKKKGVSPVTYYSGKESLAIRLLQRNENIVHPKDKVLWLSMLKKYRGKTWSWGSEGKGKYKEKVLYNEREWRYIPQSMPLNELYKLVPYCGFSGKAISDNTKKYGLRFAVSDIRYIIIKDEKEREEFLSKLKNIIPKEPERSILSSKILTFEQIQEDF